MLEFRDKLKFLLRKHGQNPSYERCYSSSTRGRRSVAVGVTLFGPSGQNIFLRTRLKIIHDFMLLSFCNK